MDVSSPVLPATAVVWQPRAGQLALTVVVKASFDLVPGTATLAAEHEPLIEHDQHWDDDPSRFLVAASEVVPAKRRVDVLYVGRAVGSPGGGPTFARLRVGSLEKTIEAHGERWPALGPVGMDRRGAPAAVAWARAWATRPMPDDVGTGIFNAAPADQQLDELPADATLVLENLAPAAPTLTTTLPRLAPRAHVELAGGRKDVPLRPDTVSIDGGRGTVSIVWRGQVGIEHPSHVRRVVVDADGDQAPRTSAGPALGPLVRRPARTAMAPTAAGPESRSLPFAKGAPGAPPPALPAAAPPSWSSFDARGETAAIPILDEREPPPAPPPARALPPVAPPVAAPPRAAPPQPMRAIDPPQAVPPAPAAAPIARPWGSPPAAYAAPAPIGTPRGPIAPPQHVSSAALGGVSAASDAAADGAPREGATRAATRRPTSGLRLLWHDEASVLRIRTQPAWRPILTRRERRAPDRGAFESADAEDAGEVLAIVREGDPAREAAIAEALELGFDDEGRFEPELMLVEGELVLALDELETLKAVVATTTPYASKDEGVRRAVEIATAYAASPVLVSPEAIARKLTDDVRRAWGAWKDRPLDAEQVDELASRAVLERRAYRVRDLFGGAHVRAAITLSGSTTAVPTYLPEAAAKKLPLFLRFPARLVAEAHPREDEAEEHPAALRVVAMARTIGEPRGG